MKGGLALLLSPKKGKGPDGESSGAEDSGEGESLHKDAAAEVLAAIKSSDAGELSTALKNFYDLCSSEPGDEEDSE